MYNICVHIIIKEGIYAINAAIQHTSCLIYIIVLYLEYLDHPPKETLLQESSTGWGLSSSG